MMHKKGGGRESGGGLGTTKRALPQVEPVAAANPAAHDHTNLAYDVAGCRGCYLRGSRWPWPGGDPIQEKRILALEAELELRKNAADGVQELLVEAAKDKLRAERAEARVAELKGELTRVRNLFQAGGWVTERVKVEKVLRPREREEC